MNATVLPVLLIQIMLELTNCYVAEARHELKAYLHSLKEQFAGIDKMKALTKEEKVSIRTCICFHCYVRTICLVVMLSW